MYNSNYPSYSDKTNQNIMLHRSCISETINGNNIFQYPDNIKNALSLIKEATAGESEDRLFYTYLLENAPTKQDKQIISEIRNDEINHFSMFNNIYYQITGTMIQQQSTEEYVLPKSYCEGLRKAIFDEQKAVKKYRQILYGMQEGVHQNMLIDIITDEIRHGSLYNYLYTKNLCSV